MPNIGFLLGKLHAKSTIMNIGGCLHGAKTKIAGFHSNYLI